MPDHLLYGLAWASFGLLHSLLAGGPSGPLRALGPWHRVAYNAIAALHLVLVLAAGHLLLGDRPAYPLPGAVRVFGLLAAAAGAAILAWGLWGYDRGRFLGTSQLRAARAGVEEPEDEPLRVTGANRWVRHPLYLGAFLLLWGVVRDPLSLSTAIWASAYLAVGHRVEERRLLRLYGEDYARYRAGVPALFPWRGRPGGPRRRGVAPGTK